MTALRRPAWTRRLLAADISVDPYRRSLPSTRERRLPHGGSGIAIDLPFQCGNGLPRLPVVDSRRTAAMEVVRPWHRAAGRINALQRA